MRSECYRRSRGIHRPPIAWVGRRRSVLATVRRYVAPCTEKGPLRAPFGLRCAGLPRGGACARFGTPLTSSAVPRETARLAVLAVLLEVPRCDCHIAPAAAA